MTSPQPDFWTRVRRWFEDRELQRRERAAPRRIAAARRTARPATEHDRVNAIRNKPISQVGKETAAGLACPKCGGTQFKARRTKAARAGIAGAAVATAGLGGVGAAAVTKQKKVQCVTCGTIYNRG